MIRRRRLPFILLVSAFALALAAGGTACSSDSNHLSHEMTSYNIPWDLIGIVGTGQSLSVGAFGNPVLLERIGLGRILESLGERQYNNDETIDNQLRSVEKRAKPTGPKFTMRGSPR